MRSIFYLAAFIFLFPSSVYAQNASEFTIREALAQVYQTNPSLQAARKELEATHELYPQAQAGWRPSLKGETSIYATDIKGSNFGQELGATTKDVTLSVEQPVFRGGQTVAETARAQALINSAQAQVHALEQSILLEAATAYMNVVRDRMILALREGNEQFLREELLATQERLEAGVLTRTDLSQAQARLADAISEKAAAHGSLEASNAAFERLIDTPADQVLFYPVESVFYDGTLDEALIQVEKSNPEIIAALYAQEAADHDAEGTLRKLFPQIYAFASYNKQYDPQPGLIDDSETQTVGLRASIQFYDGGFTHSRVHQAKLSASQKKIEIDRVRRDVRSVIIRQWQALQAARAEISARHLQIESATAAREGVSEEARMGERTVLDVLNADAELLDAQTALAIARRDEAVAGFSLQAALGTLAEQESVKIAGND